jgi:hypothetical protein
MLRHGMSLGLITTSLDQSFYFSNPGLSTFNARSRHELGYEVGQLGFIDYHHTAFSPSQDCLRQNLDDPFDP